jgi:flagellin
MSVINTNVSALNAQSALTVNSRNMGVVMQQLSTGSRINSAKDDAAGLAIGQNMTSQIRGLNQAVRNANDGISLLQTADGALVETSNMLQRMRELSVQSANGTLSDTQRGYLNTEFSNLSTQIGKIATETVWNGKQILSATTVAANGGDVTTATTYASIGSSADVAVSATSAVITSATAYDTYTFQTGQSATQTIAVEITAMTERGLGVSGMNISSLAAGSAAIAKLDTALGLVNSRRATIGAATNQLTYAADNMANISTNISASRSRIMDTDYAQATSQLAKTQIIQQAATAMLAQANQQPQSVLALLK